MKAVDPVLMRITDEMADSVLRQNGVNKITVGLLSGMFYGMLLEYGNIMKLYQHEKAKSNE